MCSSDLMFGHEADTEIVRDHQHEDIVHVKGLFQIGGMTGEIEVGGLCILFMKGRRHQALDLLVPKGLYGHCQGFYGIDAADIRQLTRHDGDLFFPAVVEVDLFMGDAGEVLCGLVVESQLRGGFPVEIDELVGSKDQRGTHFQQAMIREGLDDQLCPYPIYVSHGNAYYWFL